MVRAILAGKKTQTRRVVKPQPPSVEDVRKLAGTDYHLADLHKTGTWSTMGPVWAVRKLRGGAVISPTKREERLCEWPCPYGAPGDRLWCRETWFPDPPIDGSWPGDISWQDERRIDGVPEHYRKPKHCIFAASWGGIDLRWRPGIHMPRWASRITLEITGVRVERLQAITEEDAKAEGSTPYIYGHGFITEHGIAADPGIRTPSMYRASFEQLWREINGDESWDSNPFVWVVVFRLLDEQASALPDFTRGTGSL